MSLTIQIRQPVKTCKIHGCYQVIYKKGYCDKHSSWIENPNIDYFPIFKIGTKEFSNNLISYVVYREIQKRNNI